MKLLPKFAALAVGLGLVLPNVAFADDDYSSVKTSVRASTTIDVWASTTKRDTIREQLNAIKARAAEQRAELKGDLDDRREEVKEKMEDKRDEVREKTQKNIRGRLSKHLEKVMYRFEAAVRRLERIADRLDSRIVKLKERGVNTSEAESLLSAAKIKINVAASSTAAIQVAADNFANASTTATTTAAIRLDYEKVKNAIEVAKKDIRSAHRALVDVIKELKPGRNSATSTATTTNDDNDD